MIGMFIAIVLACPWVQAQEDQEIQKLIEQLGSPKLAERDAATEALVDKGKAALDEVKKARFSKDAEIALRATQIYEKIGFYDRVPETLMRSIEGLEGYLKKGQCYKALVRLRSAGPTDNPQKLTVEEWKVLVKETMREKNSLTPDEKVTVVDCIVENNISELAGDLVLLLSDREYIVREQTAFALGRLRVKGVIKNIAELLKDRDPGVRNTSILALRQMQAKEYAPEIAECLKHRDTDERCGAAQALADFQANQFILQIAELLNDEDPATRSCAVSSLARMRGEEVLLTIKKLLDDPVDHVRAAAREAIEKLEGKKPEEKMKDEPK